MKYFKYLRYLSKAKGRHGVHSPFVYGLLEHLKYQKNKHLLETMQSYCRQYKFEQFDYQKHLCNQTMYIVEKPHTAGKTKWQMAKNHPDTKISLDFFSLGFVMNRTAQYNVEHFTLIKSVWHSLKSISIK
jgi:hypothetical protein